MKIRSIRTRKRIAIFFLGLLVTQSLMPSIAWALTSGPTQPEMKQFSPAGLNDMVDLFSGDFQYNIPLLDVDGYPVNLNYKSGAGMDDEASWVGLGWNLNVGAINRQLRGVADDSYGDSVKVENYMKPKITYGGMASVRGELFGGNLNGTLSVSVTDDNYNGIGASLGVNAGLSLVQSEGGALTSGLNVGITSSTSDGVTVSPSLSLSVHTNINEINTGLGTSFGIHYNSREGLKTANLGASFDIGRLPAIPFGVSINYNTPVFYPKVSVPFASSSYTFSLDAGPAGEGAFGGLGGSGFKTTRQIASLQMTNPAYGFMYAEKGKDVPNALMDFTREKDNPVTPDLKNLAVPIATPDLFSFTGQNGSGQFRLYRHSAGVLFDNHTEEASDNSSTSVEVGLGAYGHGGVNVYKQHVSNITGKWVTGNNFLTMGDYAGATGAEEGAYFKQVGEKDANDPTFLNQILGEGAVSVPLSGKQAQTQLMLGNKLAYTHSPAPLKKNGRQVRREPILALTAEQAAVSGIDKQISIYPFNQSNSDGSFTPAPCNNVAVVKENRVNSFRKPKHISEISIVQDNGVRMVYGIPVYNKLQDEYSFATSLPDTLPGYVYVPSDGKGGINHKPVDKAGHSNTDEYYHHEKQPSYASSYLLTQVLSPDYEDVTGDGISADDRGTVTKFNYSRVDGDYGWRAPIYPNKAILNKGLLADPDDDKASFVHGEKEVWYVNSIESKTKIAYFITEDRDDAIGVDWMGKLSTVRQKRLKEIRLYSKADLTTPIKTVVFQYNYNLCQGTPNSQSVYQGKLTLASVYFTYGSSTKASANPYKFEYDQNHNVGYTAMSSDIWGNYKGVADNAPDGFGQLRNDEFPYTTRSAVNENMNVQPWQLNKITLPSGGTIEASYESDDYAYVQDKAAMQMYGIKAAVDKDGNVVNSGVNGALNIKGFQVTLPPGSPDVTEAQFINEYLNGTPYVYAKCFINMTDDVSSTDNAAFDFVSAYARVKKGSVKNGVATIIFEDDTEGNVTANPLLTAAWQKMRLEYPRYAYPGYKNRITDDRPVSAVLSALLNALKTVGEITTNFNQRASKKGFCQTINMAKSFVRLTKRDGPKLGGGLRVKSIISRDIWSDMVDNEQQATYGQEYDYTLKDADGNTVMTDNNQPMSSGVAANEPNMGGDENAIHSTTQYRQDVSWGLTNYFYLEKPMGETLFPAPSVGYRSVTVRNLVNGLPDASHKTGSTTTEFYTAKDFPVFVEESPFTQYEHKPKSWSNFFGGSSLYELAMSQGYSVTLNDMHGKEKKNIVRDQNNKEVSSTEYIYSTTEEGGVQKLSNVVDVVDNTGQISKDQVIGREIEMFTDMRSSEMFDSGKSTDYGFDLLNIFWFPIPVPHWPFSSNTDYRSFNSSCVLKTIQYYGVVTQVIKKVNGSVITAQNLVYDRYTGNPVVTTSQNEFNDNVYIVNIPAYWTTGQMGMAYHNLGMLLKGFTVHSDGRAPDLYQQYLQDGDELINVATGERAWVINSPTSDGLPPSLRVIDERGVVRGNYVGDMLLYRSGYRNQLTASATTMTMLQSPVEGNRLSVLNKDADLTRFKVLNASAMLYATGWEQPADCVMKACSDGYVSDGNGGCVWNATPSANTFTLQTGGSSSDYGTLGGYFYNDANPKKQYIIQNGNSAWATALSSQDLWLSGLQPGKWFGVEKCLNFVNSGYYFFGYAADEAMRIYVDGVKLDELSDPGDPNNHRIWHIRKHNMTAGKHTVRIDAMDASGTAKGVALSIYTSAFLDILNDPNLAQSSTMFGSRSFIGDPGTLIFTSDSQGAIVSQNYNCLNGAPINICNGSFTCGPTRKPNGCPAGQTLSSDGKTCLGQYSLAHDTTLDIAVGSQLAVYSEQGAIFHDASGVEGYRISGSSYWGAMNCSTGSGARVANASTTPSQTIGQSEPSAIHNDTASAKVNSALVGVGGGGTSLCGRLNATSFWFKGAYDQTWIGVNTCVSINTSKIYYLGYGADNKIRIYIDGILFQQDLSGGSGTFLDWRLYPVLLTAGKHILSIEGWNQSDQHAIGVEIYDGSQQDIINGNFQTVFSTANLLTATDHDTYTKDANGNIVKRALSCTNGQPVSVCDNPMGCPAGQLQDIINPFVKGYQGNWLPYQTKAWLSTRTGPDMVSAPPNGTNIRNLGSMPGFTSYWWNSGGLWGQSTNTGWVTTSTSTLYDKSIQEVETKNALNIYSSARYGFKDAVPIAVGSNMRQREIFYDGFEDYKFNDLCRTGSSCDQDGFSIRNVLGDNYTQLLNAADAHTGNYSLQLNGDLALTAYAYSFEHAPGLYLQNDGLGEYIRKSDAWMGRRGFNPVSGRNYVFSAWVKDNSGAPNSAPPLTLTVNGVKITLTRKATVEGWKLMEGNIYSTQIGLASMVPVNVILNGSSLLIDDIRIFPFDGQLKSYAYDEKTQREMAELDENNYATFYEYDEEGALIRVKKETERGIMTIKESRNALRKQ
jgi:hypothetical protein